MGKRSKLKAKLNATRPNFLEQISHNKITKPKRPIIVPPEPEATQYVDETLSSKILKEASRQTQELMKDEKKPQINLPQNSDQEHDFSRDFVRKMRQELSSLKCDSESQADLQDMNYEEMIFDELIQEDCSVTELLSEKLMEIESQVTCSEYECSTEIGEEAKVLYERVGKFFSQYRAGPIPKAFKVLPCIPNWMEILSLTEPTGWTAAAIYEATRIFVSRLQSDKAKDFLSLVLLPRIRDDIKYYKKLNFHIFRALKKALFKPAAFFKGILLPLCGEPDFTLREATILSAALSKSSIPVEHSSAAIIFLTKQTGGNSGARDIVIKVLLEKRYALPYQTVDSLVAYFMGFERQEKMNVLWHCTLMAFVKHYAVDLADEQVDMLWGLLRSCRHPKITPLIRSLLTETRRVHAQYTQPFDASMCVDSV